MREPVKQQRHVWFVDLTAILVVGALGYLAATTSFGDKFLWRMPVVTLWAFYFMGKYARNFELRLWEKRHAARAPRREGAS